MESDMFDDSQSDSGVSADFSPCSTLEGTTTSTGSLGTFSTETPIEKEIRRAIEREHSLRRSRGLPNLPASPEYAEIPLRKTVLSQSLTSKSEWSQDKDRDFAGKKMLHEIHKEARREQDLLKIGKIPGSYDKGTAPQIKEKKQLFEAFQTPSNATYSISAKSKTASWSSDSSSSSSNSTLENQEEITSQRPTLGDSRVYGSHGIDLLKPTHSQDFPKGGLTNSTLRGPGSSEGTGCQLIILESNPSVPAQMRHHVKAETEAIAHSEGPSNSAYRAREHGGLTGREQEEKEDVASKENPFYKLRPSTNLVKVKQDILVAQEREKELRSQRISLYGGIQAGEGGGVQLISLEGKSPSSSSSKERLDMPDMPGSTSKGGTGPSAGRQSFGKLCMWPPAQGEEERTHRSEVLQGPRTPRQKTPLVQRWESGLIDGYNLEDD
ncbi:uncharacterized protein misp3 [Odontesthes bonariensis]|uniref:uncharacterized protein misp3 n=1 Tax=Odontesthes bonariensis TaxID=219752 RepID=UPI003F5886FF